MWLGTKVAADGHGEVPCFAVGVDFGQRTYLGKKETIENGLQAGGKKSLPCCLKNVRRKGGH